MTVANLVKTANLKHVAIIMDGNRRWAKERNLPTAYGHKKGVESLKNILRACNDFGIEYLTVYAFSTENWKRTQEEVNFLMDLISVTLSNELEEMHKENVQIHFIGDLTRLSDKLQKTLQNATDKTKNNDGVKLQIAINYGARDELVNAVKQIVKSDINAEDITAETISKYLYTSNIPDPDLLIRTGGEKRISNYLLWQIAYSEVIIFDTYWPDFGKQELNNAIEEFVKRQRRYGK